MTLTIIAFYFGVLISGQDWPVMIGPYETWAECASVREYLDRRDYVTDSCAPLPVPQEESQHLSVGYLPTLTERNDDVQ